MEKVCSKCKQSKPLEEFHLSSTRKYGRHSYCKICVAACSKKVYEETKLVLAEKIATQRNNRREKIKYVLDKIKKENGCYFCGENTPCCIDFHHLDPQQKKDTVAILSHKKGVHTLLQELFKCACICTNCHRKVHDKLLSTIDQPSCIISQENIDLLLHWAVFDRGQKKI